MATVIIKKGTLKIGDPFVCGAAFGKVRTILDERSQKLTKAEPSDPVVISGFDFPPKPADIFAVVQDEREARKIATERQKIEHEHQKRQVKEWSLDTISAQIAEGKIKQLNVILKGDFDGTVEAIGQTLQDLGNEEVAVNIIHKAAGNITESDVLLAKTSQAIVIGFNVSANPKVNDLAKKENVEIRHYSIIYELIKLGVDKDDIYRRVYNTFSADRMRLMGYCLYKKMKIGEQAMYMAQLKGLSHKDAMAKIKKWLIKFEMESWWNKNGEDMPKGMGQKLQFVTTVLHEPKLIILDEPFSGLDPVNSNLIKDEIYNLAKSGSTIIFSTCLLYTSDAADDLLCVDLGGRRIIKKKKTHITKCRSQLCNT